MVVGSNPSGGGGGVEVERRFGGWGGWEGGSGGFGGVRGGYGWDKKKIFFLKKNDLDGAACHFFENTYEKKNTVSDVKHV